MKKDHVDFIQEQWQAEMPEVDTSPMGIIGRISRISRYLDHYLQRVYSDFDLNGGEFDVLATLRRAGRPFQLTPTQLFNALMLTSGAMTNRLDRLEAMGLIARLPNPNDRRGILVTLTDSGKTLMDKAYPVHMANEDSMLQSLSPDERQMLSELLRKLLYAFEQKE